MNNQICQKCGMSNASGMRFCSNCGQALSASFAGPASGANEPPPTVVVNQMQNTPKPPAWTPPPPPQTPNAAPKKSGKGWIFGIAGCLGLLLLSAVGLGAAFYFFGNMTGEDNNANSKGNYERPANRKENVDNSDNFLVKILQTNKQIGEFNQTSVKSLDPAEYFPLADEAAQAMYEDGSKIIYLTVGKFDSMSKAERNFKQQLEGIKSEGGKITFQDTSVDGTISALYTKGNFYFAEYCNTSFYCNRMHSDNQAALRSFIQSYSKLAE